MWNVCVILIIQIKNIYTSSLAVLTVVTPQKHWDDDSSSQKSTVACKWTRDHGTNGHYAIKKTVKGLLF